MANKNADMAHGLGIFFKYLAAFLILSFSVTLGYLFFSSIAPPSIPWFVPAAMGLTEGGLLCWLAVFMLTKHDNAKKVIALLMIAACLVAVLVTDSVELASLFQVNFVITRSWVYLTLILMFAGHMLAFISDFFVSYFREHPFSEEKIIPSTHRNLIPKDAVEVEELEAHGYARPLVEQETVSLKHLSPMKRVLALEEDTSIREAIKEGASTLMKKAKSSIKRGKTAAPAPGTMNTSTSGNGSTGESSSDDIPPLDKEKIRENAKQRFRELKAEVDESNNE